MPRTLVIFKPDCVQRRLVGKVLRRFESKGLQVVALKLMQVSKGLAEQHYTKHKDRPFFPNLLAFLTGGPVIVGVLEGPEAVTVVRNLVGATDGVAAAPGTIRGDFAFSKQFNLVHGSDGPESTTREIALWFQPEELVGYTIAGDEWLH